MHLLLADMREEGKLLPLLAITPVKQGIAWMLFHARS
jgi:hypothetical protein